ncbi:hypothetical protein AAE478_009593 [Parahypoxylon ruwenzoriense]
MEQTSDKQRVYLACRDIFTGEKGQFRKKKKVRAEIEKHALALETLIHDLGEDSVIRIVRKLLEQHVFESEIAAKVEFPELFRSSPGPEIQREAPEINAAQSAAEVREEIASIEEARLDNDDEFGGKYPFKETSKDEREVEAAAPKQIALPLLYPISIPYKTQHLILNEAQRMLEESCFEFGQKWLPTVLKGEGWDCAYSAELTKWTSLLAEKVDTIPGEAFNLGGTSLTEGLLATNELRQSAVHRLPMTARSTRDLVQSAVALALALRDSRRASQLQEICYEIDSKIRAMELHKNALKKAATTSLEEIQRQREELDRKEKEVIAGMIRDDHENKGFIGDLLEDLVSKILEEKTEMEDAVEVLKTDQGENESDGSFYYT